MNARFSTAWNHILTPATGAIDYAPWYQAIGHCNLLLDKIESFPFSDESAKNRIKAETYSLRAYFFFHLSRIIGDAPLMLEPIASENVPLLPRSPAADVLQPPAFSADQSHMLIFGGDDGMLASRVMELKEHHPGFSSSVIAYNATTDTWSEIANVPDDGGQRLNFPVTTPLVTWNKTVILPGGEIRPGVRTTQVIQISP